MPFTLRLTRWNAHEAGTVRCRLAVLAECDCPVLQLWRGHGNAMEIGAVPRADPLAARVLESPIARPRGQRTVALGVALLSPGKNGKNLLSADESRRSHSRQDDHHRQLWRLRR